MSPKWKARIAMGVFGVILLVLGIVRAPEVGWWGAGLAVVYLILVFTVVGRESKRPPRPLKQRRVINTAVFVVGSTLILTVPDIIRGEETWDGFLFAFFLSIVGGVIVWFATRPDEAISGDAREGNR